MFSLLSVYLFPINNDLKEEFFNIAYLKNKFKNLKFVWFVSNLINSLNSDGNEKSYFCKYKNI